MKKQFSIKLFAYILEIKLRNKSDNGKLKLLVESLFTELENQGYDTCGVGDRVKYISVFDHGNSIHIGGNGGCDISFNKGDDESREVGK